MTGQQAVDLIHERAWTGRKPGLSRTFELLKRLGNPHERLKFVHITGTNGKGSTAAMVSSVLARAGLRTGLYTSPHLWTFHERFQVDGVPISDELLGELGELVIKAGEGMEDPPTEFELMTALGMEFFLRAGCDIVVLEVGLGGRLDSTNVIPAPEAAVITNIGLEHTQELGNTCALIAHEKAGIIKPGSSAVLYHQSREVEEVVEKACKAAGCPLTITAPDALTLTYTPPDYVWNPETLAYEPVGGTSGQWSVAAPEGQAARITVANNSQGGDAVEVSVAVDYDTGYEFLLPLSTLSAAGGGFTTDTAGTALTGTLAANQEADFTLTMEGTVPIDAALPPTETAVGRISVLVSKPSG